LFEGNTDGSTPKTHYFETPIIAQYIRINPTRWNARISMRVQLYGCHYGELYFNVIVLLLLLALFCFTVSVSFQNKNISLNIIDVILNFFIFL
ncbi:hypothetical protein B4U80_03954, partial [Leptotrombidium deliense]